MPVINLSIHIGRDVNAIKQREELQSKLVKLAKDRNTSVYKFLQEYNFNNHNSEPETKLPFEFELIEEFLKTIIDVFIENSVDYEFDEKFNTLLDFYLEKLGYGE